MSTHILAGAAVRVVHKKEWPASLDGMPAILSSAEGAELEAYLEN